jgi:hypothetical protein
MAKLHALKRQAEASAATPAGRLASKRVRERRASIARLIIGGTAGGTLRSIGEGEEGSAAAAVPLGPKDAGPLKSSLARYLNPPKLA